MALSKDEIKEIQKHIYSLVEDETLTKGANNMFFTFLMAEEGEIPQNIPYSLEDYLAHNTEGARVLKMFWQNMRCAIEEYYNE